MATSRFLAPSEAVKVLKKIPDEVLFVEAKERRAQLRETEGKYATLKRYRECKGCHQKFSAREMRTHACVIGAKRR